ncbi:MAG TPA: transcription termination factor NusA [Vicinamibacterales bacterium]
MTSSLLPLIETMAKEKGVEPSVIIAALEDAMLTASRKAYKTNEDLRSRLNPETGQIEIFAVKHIVEKVENEATEISLDEARKMYGDEAELDMEIEFPKPPIETRIAAQTVKQVLSQKTREAEREKVYDEYSQRIGEVVTATVKRFETGDIIAEMGRVEAILPRREQSRAENYNIGDRVRAVIKSVNKNAKGPQIVLSRTDPALLIKLFEQEVPEIYDGTVMIRGAVREAGDRAKVAVYSRERDVDPVGACVGMKGTRVQAIIRELRGEKIDIVEWSEDDMIFVTNAISPAKVQRVTIMDPVERIMEVVVEDRQLSLAIGKKGQNVRLAAKLTGWKIDIKSEEEKRREIEAQFPALAADALAAAGGTATSAAEELDALFGDNLGSADVTQAEGSEAAPVEEAPAEAGPAEAAPVEAGSDVSAEPQEQAATEPEAEGATGTETAAAPAGEPEAVKEAE